METPHKSSSEDKPLPSNQKDVIDKKPKKSKSSKKRRDERLKKMEELAKEVNAADYLKQDEDALLKQKPKFLSNLNTKFYEPNNTAKGKHHISSLAYELQQNEERIEEKKVAYSLRKKDGRQKYGW
ncbi:Ribosome biogenesis protein NOP53 [Entamoeba marina]